ncbi:MAG: hypothetical protein ACKV22_17290 [Bryobacteraceae bacterium]
MESLTIRSRVGPDGILHLDVTSGFVDTELEVTLTLQPVPANPKAGQEALGWSDGFFGEVVGGWEGEPIRREPEGDFEKRLEL